MHLLKPEVTVYSHELTTRSYAKKLDLAYPHPDSAIRDYLDRAIPNLQEGQTVCWRLLGHLFSTVSEELTRLYGKSKQPTYVELARSWRRHMEKDQNRATIYENVVKKCHDGLVCPLFTIFYSDIHYSL